MISTNIICIGMGILLACGLLYVNRIARETFRRYTVRQQNRECGTQLHIHKA